MDIRRLVLWEGRSATYMSNEIFNTVIEDQGDVMLELSANALSGTRINALSLPYFRGTGSGVMSDPNGEWWQGKQSLYQAGGAYFTFSADPEGIRSTDVYWSLRRYGTAEECGGVWRYSEMKSREEGNRFHLAKVDMLIPGHPAVYTAVKMKNTSSEPLAANASWHTMLGYPAIETGTMIQSNAKCFIAYGLASRETGVGRFKPAMLFDDLKHAPLARGGTADAGYIPPPTGTYDYIIGKFPEKEIYGWVSVNNVRSQLIYFLLTPRREEEERDFLFPNTDLAENWLGRMDAPWALYDGGVPNVMALTCGFNTGPKGTRNMILRPGEERIAYFANGFMSYDSPRIAMGYYSNEFTEEGVVFKRTKSWTFMPLDHRFKALRAQSAKVFSTADEVG